MNFIIKILTSTLITASLITASTISFAGDKILWQNDGHNIGTKKADVLNKVLSTNHNTGYAGIAPICEVNNKKYIMISSEANNGDATGTFCDSGGKVDMGETVGKAMLREFYEESSRVYDYRNKAIDLLKDSRICYRNSFATAFFEVDYKKRQEFLDARTREAKIKHNGCFHEKSDFLWVDIESLYDSLNTMDYSKGKHPSISVNVLNDDGTQTNKNIQLRDFFAKTLKNSKSILNKYINKKNNTNHNLNINNNIKTITSLKEINITDFKDKTLLILDLDENLVVEKWHSPQKYHHLIPQHSTYRLIEQDIAKTIENFKNSVGGDGSKVVVLGVTKRSLTKNGHADEGHKILEKENIPTSRLRFKKHNGKTLCGNKNAGFINGVIYTDGNDKGDHVEDFLNLAKYTPSQIIMSDDKRKNLINVHAYAQKMGIPMVAYEMTGVNHIK